MEKIINHDIISEFYYKLKLELDNCKDKNLVQNYHFSLQIRIDTIEKLIEELQISKKPVKKFKLSLTEVKALCFMRSAEEYDAVYKRMYNFIKQNKKG